MKTWMQAGAMAAPMFLLLAGCDRIPGNIGGDKSTPGDKTQVSCDVLFLTRIQPQMEYCRTCHVPGGTADTADGKLFQLSQDRLQDEANLRASWEALGRNDNGLSRILLMPSGQDSVPHTGGTPWPVGSRPYNDMKSMLEGFVDPAACKLSNGGSTAYEHLPLLGSRHAKTLWATFCEDQPDDAALPQDPRSRIQPGVNQGLAVYYNAWWQDCHANAPEAEKQAKTCGEYRSRRDAGKEFLLDILPASPVSADDFNNTWKSWGLTERPANFDQMYTLRYGLNQAPYPNPYPLPGEDPNQTHGGSGQLPIGLRQTKGTDGKWTGQIASGACFLCHGGQLGDPFNGEKTLGMENLGLGNDNYDVLMAGHDKSPWSGTGLAPLAGLLPALNAETLFNIGIKQRGQNNAVGAFELLNTILDFDTLGLNPDPAKMLTGPTGVQDISHPLAHTQDTPAWWNMGSRPRKFFDAGVSNDSTRIIMAAGPGEISSLLTLSGKPYRDRIEKYDQDPEAFFLSLRSPDYPREIDTALAEQGAILFHTKNLFADPANAQRPKPLGGNGSCASCHGAYSPRFVNDPSYLEDPSLEGVAGHISPLEVIGTDRARSDMLTPTLRRGWDTTYWAYPEGTPGYVPLENKTAAQELADDVLPNRPTGLCGWEKEIIGYQAPPLYGVWATAPYFHNGSVPTVEAVLDSSRRTPIWERQLQTIGPVTGFDQRMGEAYDFDSLGWKHTDMACGDIPGSVLLNCNPVSDTGPSLVEIVQNLLNSTLSWAGIVPIPDPTPGGFDKRLVYDTRILGNGNAGHEFTDVLTGQERRAVMEYLKTL